MSSIFRIEIVLISDLSHIEHLGRYFQHSNQLFKFFFTLVHKPKFEYVPFNIYICSLSYSILCDRPVY